MKRLTFVILVIVAAAGSPMRAQSPAPVIVQAVTQPQAPAAPAQAGAPAPAASGVVLKALQDMKAANDEVLKRQAATLQQLEEIEKAAEQLKIYSKRG
jgi:hypothetical protein